MSMLSKEQIHQLNMYSVYLNEPVIPLFRLDGLMTNKTLECLDAVQAISKSPSSTVTASYFMRRWGMFISMQFYLLTSSNIVWDGRNRAVFGAVEEYGLRTIGTFVKAEDFREVRSDERKAVIHQILKEQCHEVIRKIRQTCPVSPLTLWENIFGYLIWHYHVFLSTPQTSLKASIDWEALCSDDVWKGISNNSRFQLYTGGKGPSQLLNSPVRKSCCFSKDVPGLMKCTFCPLSD
jgi:ferric iron reductase protein FhuF